MAFRLEEEGVGHSPGGERVDKIMKKRRDLFDNDSPCPGANGTQVGTLQPFKVMCSIQMSGDMVNQEMSTSFVDCVDSCASSHPRCDAVTYDGMYCHMMANIRNDAARPSRLCDSAIAKPIQSSSNCSTLGGSATFANARWTTHCDKMANGPDVGENFAATFQDCMGLCTITSGCHAVSYDHGQFNGYQNCYMKGRSWQQYDLMIAGGFDSAILQSKDQGELQPSLNTTSPVFPAGQGPPNMPSNMTSPTTPTEQGSSNSSSPAIPAEPDPLAPAEQGASNTSSPAAVPAGHGSSNTSSPSAPAIYGSPMPQDPPRSTNASYPVIPAGSAPARPATMPRPPMVPTSAVTMPATTTVATLMPVASTLSSHSNFSTPTTTTLGPLATTLATSHVPMATPTGTPSGPDASFPPIDSLSGESTSRGWVAAPVVGGLVCLIFMAIIVCLYKKPRASASKISGPARPLKMGNTSEITVNAMPTLRGGGLAGIDFFKKPEPVVPRLGRVETKTGKPELKESMNGLMQNRWCGL